MIYLKQQFRSRFGPNSPEFYPGALLDAVNRASRRYDDEESLLGKLAKFSTKISKLYSPSVSMT